MKNIDLSTTLCGVKLRNPLVLASGIVDTTASSLIYAIENGAGAAITKSISPEPRKGHKEPIVHAAGMNSMINAVGLSNPGIDAAIQEIKDAKKRTKEPIIANIFASTVKEFGESARRISEAKPDLIEVNISCPNVDDEFGKPFSCDPALAAEVTKVVRKNTKIPVLIKLSPNIANISAIAKAVESAGADGITCINTVGGMVIDIETATPVLSNKSGGWSGAAIKPVAVKAIYECYRAVKIPILGMGGVLTGKDAVELLMAGAAAVGIGTAVYYRGISVFKRVNDEIEAFMRSHGLKTVKEIVGRAHLKNEPYESLI
ncbi:dihydroorotate dehydrogenase [Candidatus Woesearchaeota archaeon]|nr:dihydroorotate dehydrogenase [Candidatus Woesearchaeota archaeon]